LEAIATVSLDLVQFDGGIPADWARFIPVPVIRRFASPISSSTKTQAHEDASSTNTAIVYGVNDASQINRPGLHSIALVDLTVCSGSNNVYVPSKNDSTTTTPSSSSSDISFKLATKDTSTGSSSSGAALQGVEGAKKITAAGELGGKWVMPVMMTAGRQKVGLEIIREIGAWGVDVEVGGKEDSLEGYIKDIQG